VVEYNGDYWHCNPRIWKADDFNKSIKMFAKDKWEKDYVRYVTLRKMGYTVIVIWESGWIKNPEKYINRIKEVYYDKISEKDKDC
jgi:G:T-mismatch repair DNA endonuclease (very short patch repair protein)